MICTSAVHKLRELLARSDFLGLSWNKHSVSLNVCCFSLSLWSFEILTDMTGGRVKGLIWVDIIYTAHIRRHANSKILHSVGHVCENLVNNSPLLPVFHKTLPWISVLQVLVTYSQATLDIGVPTFFSKGSKFEFKPSMCRCHLRQRPATSVPVCPLHNLLHYNRLCLAMLSLSFPSTKRIQ